MLAMLASLPILLAIVLMVGFNWPAKRVMPIGWAAALLLAACVDETQRLPLAERSREKGERLLDGRPHGSGNPLQEQEGQTEKQKHQENPVRRNARSSGQGCPMR